MSDSANSPGQNTGVGSLSLLQGIFPTQGLTRGLLHCRRILYQLYVYIYPLPPESHSYPAIPPLWVIAEHQAELPVLYSMFAPAVYFTHGVVYICRS